ncbi:MAG: cobalt transporter CbiM [Desulfovibrio sp.]|nr:cobalt transporter CbiM [Desulfovibrio sp.]
MHIAEGVLSPVVLASGYALTCLGTAIGLKRLDYNTLLTCGLLSAVFFIASLIHVPVGVSSAHLLACGLLGVFLGFSAFPAILAALILQAVFFQFGGITVLGVNTFTMASAAVLAHFVYRIVFRLLPTRRGLALAAFLAGFLGVAFAAFFTASALAFSDQGFQAAAAALFLAHLPIMLAEGCITMFTVLAIARMRPEYLPGSAAKIINSNKATKA